jgi:hypothetical protein
MELPDCLPRLVPLLPLPLFLPTSPHALPAPPPPSCGFILHQVLQHFCQHHWHKATMPRSVAVDAPTPSAELTVPAAEDAATAPPIDAAAAAAPAMAPATEEAKTATPPKVPVPSVASSRARRNIPSVTYAPARIGKKAVSTNQSQPRKTKVTKQPPVTKASAAINKAQPPYKKAPATKTAAPEKKSKGKRGAAQKDPKVQKSKKFKGKKLAEASKKLCTNAARARASRDTAPKGATTTATVSLPIPPPRGATTTATNSLPIPPPRGQSTATTNSLAQFSIEELTLALQARRMEMPLSEAGLGAQLMLMDQQAAATLAAGATATATMAVAAHSTATLPTDGTAPASLSSAKSVADDPGKSSVLKLVPKAGSKSGDGRKKGRIKAYSWEDPPASSFIHSAQRPDR